MTTMTTMTVNAPKRMKAKDRRQAQREYIAELKAQQGKGEDVPQQKAYKRTKMRFL